MTDLYDYPARYIAYNTKNYYLIHKLPSFDSMLDHVSATVTATVISNESQTQEFKQIQQVSAFDTNMVEACKSVVKDYRAGRTVKAAALHDILNILDIARAGDPEHVLTTD